MTARGASERGFALIAVLLVLAFVAIIGAEFAFAMRLEATAARVYKENLIAGHLAEAALEQAIREIVADYQYVGLGDPNDPDNDKDCPLVFYGRDRQPLKRPGPRKNVPLGGGQFSYCITDEESRINVNSAPPDRLQRLLEVLGLEKADRDTVIDSIADWRDPNEEHRLNGAESEDTYLKLPVPYRSKNGNIESIGELIQIKGITPKLMDGVDGKPGLASLVTAVTGNSVNVNTVGKEVSRAYNVSEAGFSNVEQSRRNGPLQSAAGTEFVGKGAVTVTSRTFRIEAQGLIEGQVRARLTAVVQKRADQSGENVVVREWTGVR
jgi:general secretion pathway protein K